MERKSRKNWDLEMRDDKTRENNSTGGERRDETEE